MRLVIAAPAAAIAMVIGRWLSSQRTMTGPPARGSRRPTMSKYDHQNPKPTDSAIKPVAIVSASRSALARPSTTPKMTSPRTMIVKRPNRSISECVGVNATPKSGIRPNPIRRQPCHYKRRPHEQATSGSRSASRAPRRRRSPCRRRRRRSGPVLGLVLAPHREPLPAHDREQRPRRRPRTPAARGPLPRP